jgi:hypothetical protein
MAVHIYKAWTHHNYAKARVITSARSRRKKGKQIKMSSLEGRGVRTKEMKSWKTQEEIR